MALSLHSLTLHPRSTKKRLNQKTGRLPRSRAKGKSMLSGTIALLSTLVRISSRESLHALVRFVEASSLVVYLGD